MPWPSDVQSIHEFVTRYSPLLYDNYDSYDEDVEDLHRCGIKVNGFSGQLHWMQIASWVMILIQVTFLYGLIIPMMRYPGDIILSVGCTMLSMLVLIGNVACCMTQSADPAVFRDRRWSRAEWEQYITIKYRDGWQGDGVEDFIWSDKLKGLQNGELRWCSMCHVPVLQTSYHCHSSNKCVDKMDHFCKWLNTSIGVSNYKYFKLFSLACFWTSVVQFSIGIYEFSDSFEDPDFYKTRMIAVYDTLADGGIHVMRAFTFVSSLLAMVAMVQLGYLYGFHIMLYRLDFTTVTYWQQKNTDTAQTEPTIEA